MSKRYALVDGDVLCYLSFEPRWNHNINKQGELVKQWDEEQQKFIIPQPEYTPEQNTKYIQDSYNRFKFMLRDLVDSLFVDDYMMAVQGSYNYRPEIYDLYKNNRGGKPSEMSQFVPIIREKAVRDGLGIYSHGCEADDYLRTWANECTERGDEFIIASIDKDLKCIPGLHYNIKKKEYEEVDEAYALNLYYKQLLMGDQIDAIPGILGIGPKKADKIILGCQTHDEYQLAVVEAYINAYGDDWKQFLLANGKLIHIQRYLNDWFDLSDWPLVQEMSK